MLIIIISKLVKPPLNTVKKKLGFKLARGQGQSKISKENHTCIKISRNNYKIRLWFQFKKDSSKFRTISLQSWFERITLSFEVYVMLKFYCFLPFLEKKNFKLSFRNGERAFQNNYPRSSCRQKYLPFLLENFWRKEERWWLILIIKIYAVPVFL